MIQIIKASLTRILDFYKEKGLSYFNFSLYFCFLGFIVAVIFVIIPAHIAHAAFTGSFSTLNLLDYSVIAEPSVQKWAEELVYSLLIIQLGLYAVYLKMNLENNMHQPKIKGLLKKVFSKSWLVFLITSLLFIILHILTYEDIFYTQGYTQDHFGYTVLIDASKKQVALDQFYTWLNSIIELILIYLPYLAAFFIVISSMYTNINFAVFRDYGKSIVVILILAFCSEAFVFQLEYYLGIYVLQLIKVPFYDSIPVTIFFLLTKILVFSYFYLLFVSVILFPVLNAKK